MDHRSTAEQLPGLYRAILDGVARLERVGERREAARIRSEATQAYSTAWDDANRRRLEHLLRRLRRSLEPHASKAALADFRDVEAAPTS